jgi:hypothetical protein
MTGYDFSMIELSGYHDKVIMLSWHGKREREREKKQ